MTFYFNVEPCWACTYIVGGKWLTNHIRIYGYKPIHFDWNTHTIERTLFFTPHILIKFLLWKNKQFFFLVFIHRILYKMCLYYVKLVKVMTHSLWTMCLDLPIFFNKSNMNTPKKKYSLSDEPKRKQKVVIYER